MTKRSLRARGSGWSKAITAAGQSLEAVVGLGLGVELMQPAPGRRPHILPTPLSAFVGRQAEVAEVQRHILRRRLVTLDGSGGAGKTRLALQVATQLLADYSDGVLFVDLSPLVDAALQPQVVLVALGGGNSVGVADRVRLTRPQA
jgi:hypothetical protein